MSFKFKIQKLKVKKCSAEVFRFFCGISVDQCLVPERLRGKRCCVETLQCNVSTWGGHQQIEGRLVTRRGKASK